MFLIFSKKERTDKYGKEQEERVCKYLKRKGYEILERNFKCKVGEIDIICEKDERIIFIEVKSRTNTKFGYGRDAISEERTRHTKNASIHYLKNYVDKKKSIRYDLIEVLNDEITHLEAIY